MPRNRASQRAKSEHVFGQARKPAKMLRAGLYARVSTNDQQTLAMQNRAMREYAARRGWTIALHVREVNSGAAKREVRRVYRSFDFTKRLRLWPHRPYCVAGKVNRVNTLYLVVESVKLDTKHEPHSTVPIAAEGAGG